MKLIKELKKLIRKIKHLFKINIFIVPLYIDIKYLIILCLILCIILILYKK